MPDINENDYQYAEDLPVEDHTTLDGSEKFVMFDSESGKQASLSEVAAYMDDHLDAGNKINTVKVDGTALVPDANKAVNIDLSGKVDKVTGKGLSTNDYTNTEKNKLTGIEAEANKTIVDAELDGESSNPVQNQVVTAELERLDERKAEIDGYYEEMTVGNSEELVSSVFINDSVPYNFRTSGGSIDIGNRETDQLVGGTIAWNQLANNAKAPTTRTGITVERNGDYFTMNGTTTGVFTASGWFDLTASLSQRMTGHKALVSFQFISGTASDSTQVKFYVNGRSSSIVKLGETKIISCESSSNQSEVTMAEGISLTNVKSRVQVFDLTAMFGPTIADYIYSLEQATAGAGVAWFKKLFPKPYYAYNAGELMSVNASAHKTTGFNQWDEVWEVYSTSQIKGTNPIKLIPGATYYAKAPTAVLVYFKETPTGATISNFSGHNETFTVPSNAHYGVIYSNVGYGTTYKNDISINLSWDGERDGEYESYELHEYALDPIQLRGIPKLDEFNNLYYDGDIYSSDGTVERKYGIVDLGTLNWSYNTSGTNPIFVSNADLQDKKASEVVCSVYPFSGLYGNNELSTIPDKTIASHTTSGVVIVVRDSAYTSASDFKTAMSGVYLVYELATPTTEQVDPYTNPQIVNDFGTEEYVDYGVEQGTRDVAIPVGHNTKYMANLRAKLEMAPNSPDGDGDYILRQSSGQNTYVELDPILATKAEQDGYYESMTVGNSEQLVSTIFEEDQTPYQFRTSGGSLDIGDREYMDAVVGGSVAWNQLAKVDVSGYTLNGVTFTNDPSKEYFTIDGTATANTTYQFMSGYQSTPIGHVFLVCGYKKVGSNTGFMGFAGLSIDRGNGGVWKNTTAYDALPMRIDVMSGDIFSNTKIYPIFINLTQMFGSTIADYIYSLEQATAGAGVAWFKKLFPKPYYEYNAGELLSVEGLTSHDMVGFNLLDNETVFSQYGFTKQSDGSWFISTYGPISQKTVWENKYGYNGRICISYKYKYGMSGYVGLRFGFVYTDGSFVSGFVDPSTSFVGVTKLSSNGKTVDKIVFDYGSGGIPSYLLDVNINFSWDGERDGEYEPYTKHSYPLDSSLTLRGIPKLDASNNLYFDGDQYASDGTVTRKYGVVDLGTFSYNNSGNNLFYSTTEIPNFKTVANWRVVANMVCAKYTVTYGDDVSVGTDKTISAYGTQARVFIKDTAYNDSTSLKSSLSGIYLVYELAEPTTESADPYQTPQIVDDFGTEEFVTDSIVPIGHITRYAPNLRAKLEMSPNSPDGDGDYIVRQSNGENTYVPLVIPNELPSAPSADGTYTLKVTISNGTPTYSWVTE